MAKWHERSLIQIKYYCQGLEILGKIDFGNIFAEKRTLLARIEGIQNILSIRPNPYLERLHIELLDKLEHMLRNKEIMWHHKSRQNWLRDRGRNTKFFHMSTIIQRRINKIEG